MQEQDLFLRFIIVSGVINQPQTQLIMEAKSEKLMLRKQ